MNQPITALKGSALRINLNVEAHNFARELAMACRKSIIYGPGHPHSAKAVEKPFFILNKIFKFKNCISLNVQRGALYMMNIQLKDTPFCAQVIQYMQAQDVNAILFEGRMEIRDFGYLIETMVTREKVYDSVFDLATHLSDKGINTIQINSELAYKLFEERKQYRGDVAGDFSVYRLAMDQLGDDFGALAALRNVNDEGLLELGVDIVQDMVEYLIPEKVAAFSAEHVRAVLTEMADQINAEDSGTPSAAKATGEYMALFRLLDYHPRKKEIIENLEDRQKRLQDEAHGIDDPMSETGSIKIQTSARIDQIIEEFFATTSRDYDITVFNDAFARLIRTGQQPKAIEVMTRLTDLMSSVEPDFRQKALHLAVTSIERLSEVSDHSVLEASVDDIVARLENKSETYEYSEYLWQLFESCRRPQRLDLVCKLTEAMAKRRTVNGNVTVYDSMAVKKAFENISNSVVVKEMIDKLLSGTSEETGHVRDIMIAIGSEEIAIGLSRIISHPIRAIRQLVLKILAEMGKAALKVFSRLVYDDELFQRDEHRHELSDEQWYVIRNSIFVLGSLRDQQAVASLRSRLSDQDIRVRREIITALERIGGEEAVDCLTLMAEDPLREIRQAAVIAIGLIGTPETAPLLIDIAKRNSSEAVKAMTALGKVGGEEARTFLGSLLDSPEYLAQLAAGKISKDDLRVAVVKALGEIGDNNAIELIRQYKESQSAAAKLLFKNSPVNKAITQVLSRH